MDFEPKTYLIIYAGIVISILVSFLFMRRGPPPPTQLNMGDPFPPPSPPSGARNVSPPPLNAAPPPSGKNLYAGGARLAEHEAREVPMRPRAKSLNVLFQWNGHAWDAYEVLGVPAGSAREAVDAAYTKSSQGADAESLPFYKAAYDAILKS